MAALDSSVTTTAHGAAAVTITDGAANSITMVGEISLSWEETGRSVTEARERDRHLATPNVIETGDNNMSISMEFWVRSYLGNSNVHEYEAMTFTGNASGWTTTVDGNAKCFTMAVQLIEPGAATTQTLTFPHCHLDTWSNDPRGADGKNSASVSLTSYANRPTKS